MPFYNGVSVPAPFRERKSEDFQSTVQIDLTDYRSFLRAN